MARLKKTLHLLDSKVWKSIKKLNHTLRSIELLLVIVALIFAHEAYLDAKEQIAIAKEEQRSRSVSNAWMNLADRIPGNSGKIEALELLAKENKDLFAINLSEIKNYNDTGAVTEWWDSLFGKIIVNRNAIYLVGLDLSFDNIGHSTQLHAANFEGAILLGANFAGSNLMFSNFKKAHLEGASFKGSNLSGADFRMIEDVRDVDFTDCYFFAKDPNDTKLMPIFDDRFTTKINWKKSYSITTEDERKSVLEQVNSMKQKIKEEHDPKKISNLEKSMKELLAQQFLKEDVSGNLYKIKIQQGKD